MVPPRPHHPETVRVTKSRNPLLVGVRGIALVEGAKGALVLLAGLGVPSLVHRNAQTLVDQIVRLSHLNPASEYPLIFVNVTAHADDAHLWALATAALLYSVLRGVEAYSLWHARRWAEWFALGSASLYLPAEIYQLSHRLTCVSAVVFAVNAVIVAHMAYVLRNQSEPNREAAGVDATVTLA
jgi:uncharacterized membrane protein (DUF2068 family)